MDPVDEFAAIKAKIKTLQDRADVLRQGFLQPRARLRSNQYEVVVRHQKRRVFLKDRLPAEILSDPQFWSETSSEIVTVRSLTKEIPAASADDFDVIERF